MLPLEKWSVRFVLAGVLLGLASTLNAVQLTQPGDEIIGVAAVPGAPVSAMSIVGTAAGLNNYPSAENPTNAIDGNTSTKYLNFAKTNVGLMVRPAVGPSFLSGFRFATANDSPERDPVQVVIEGTNGPPDPLIGMLNTTWTQIYSGTAALDTDPGRTTFAPEVDFTQSATSYSVYRVIVTQVRNATSANSVQFSEIQLLGTVVPEPATILLLGLAVPMMRLRRRHA